MRFHFADEITADERSRIRSRFGNYPDSFELRVFHPTPDRYTFILLRDHHMYTVLLDGRRLSDGHLEEVEDQIRRGIAIITANLILLPDFVSMRLSDYERTYPRWKVEQLFEQGKIAGLENYGKHDLST
jgi:hypothetical protein